MNLHTRFLRFRLENGMFWQRSFPTPMDYKQETRWVGAVIIVLVMLWLLAGRMDYEAALVQEEVTREAWQKVGLNCATQAMMERQHREKAVVGFVFDNKLIGIDCQVLSDKPYEGLKS